MARKRNKYTSLNIRSEVLCMMSHHIMRDLASEIRSNFFSLTSDEYTDISNKEQLTFCIRWIDDQLNAHEDFHSFYNVPNFGTSTIVSVIKDAI